MNATSRQPTMNMVNGKLQQRLSFAAAWNLNLAGLARRVMVFVLPGMVLGVPDGASESSI